MHARIQRAISTALDQSHVFIGIYWQRYGWVAPGETISGLEDEYRLAGDKPKLVYIKSPAPDREPHLKELLDGIKGAASYKYFTAASELGDLIENDLMLLLTERFESPADRPVPAATAGVPGNLPLALTHFVGRQYELETVKERLAEARMLTLTGSGGTGKTRLALQAATDLRDDFDGRVYFVDLASSRDTDAALAAIAQIIGVAEHGDTGLFQALKEHIGTQKMLLLLDNFEQVTTAAAAMAELLQECPGLKHLVTSREALHVRGEHVFPVAPLSLPDPDTKHRSVAQLAQSEAVQLFVERAQAAKPDFRLTDENAGAVAEACLRAKRNKHANC